MNRGYIVFLMYLYLFYNIILSCKIFKKDNYNRVLIIIL